MNRKILKRVLLTTATAMPGACIIQSLKGPKRPKKPCWLYITEKSPWATEAAQPEHRAQHPAGD